MGSRHWMIEAAWRVAVLALLAWIAVELHFIRDEMPSSSDFTDYLSSIERSALEVNETAERIFRSMPTR